MTATATAITPFDTATVPGALGSALRYAAHLGWSVSYPAYGTVVLTSPTGAARVTVVADMITGAVFTVYANGHRVPRPWFPVHAMAQATTGRAPVSLSKIYVPLSTYTER